VTELVMLMMGLAVLATWALLPWLLVLWRPR